MKKYHVTDAETGEAYDITETEEAPAEGVKEEPEALTAEEISALKMLAVSAPKLIALLDEEETEEVKEAEKNAEENEEEVIDTEEATEDACGRKTARDSFGAIETKNAKRVDDSIEDPVSAAWSKRLNGGK